jgi:hypothetical protein
MEMIGSQSPEAMFKMAQGLRDDRLTAILAGQDDSLPQYVAQAVLSGRQRIRQAHAGQQAQAQMAQQQQSKKDELLAQAQNIQGIASVAPDSVAQLAGGGIVAFSGESGNQEVRQPSRGLNEAYRRTGTLLPETSGYEGLGPIDFIRRIFGEGADVLSRADARLKRRSMQSALPAYNPDVSTSDLPSTANSRSPTPVEAAQAAPAPAPTRSVGGGGGGGGGRAAPAAAAPAAAQGVNLDKYFLPLGNAPQLGPVAATNPYEKAKPTEEYIKDHKALLKQFGVEENPYAEREAELKAAQAGEAEKRRNAGLMGLFNFGTMLAGSGGRNVAQSIGMAGQKAAERYQADVEKLDALEEKRKEAMQAIRLANNEIKRGHVEKGLAARDKATKDYNDAQVRIEDMTARRQEQQAQQETQVYQTQTQRDVAMGQAGVQADLELRKLAQQLQISEAQLKAEYAKIGAMRASGGPRTPAEIQLIERFISDPKFAEGYRAYMGVKRPDNNPLAALGINNPPAGAVREKGK